MGEPIFLETTRLDSPLALQALLDTASRFCGVFGLVSETDRAPGDLLDELEPYLIERSEVLEWPGTISDEGPSLLSRFTATEESLRILHRALPRLLLDDQDWDTPHDLHFLRPDGSPALVTISCQDEIMFELRADELGSISDRVRQLLGLRPPPPLTTVHSSPAWGDRADTVVDAPIDSAAGQFEELACRKIRPGVFEVCCIPFHLQDLALGDIIRAASVGQRQVFASRLTESGRFVADVRVSLIRNSPQDVAAKLEERGYLIEWAEDRLIVVTVEDQANLEQLIDLLLPENAPAGLSVGVR